MKRFLLVLSLATALLLPAVPAFAGTVPAPYQLWGWVTIRNMTPGTNTPAKADRGSSSGGAITYITAGDGGFAVRFNGLGAVGGVAHATALDTGGHFCQVHTWFPDQVSPQDEWVEVDCFTAAGVHSSTPLTVSFLATNDDPGPLGYLYSGDPTTGHNADPTRSYNSAQGINFFNRQGVGAYTVVMPGLGMLDGNVIVSAVYDFVASSASNVKGTCVVLGAVRSTQAHVNLVNCYDLHGRAADIPFTVSFTVDEGLKGNGTGAVAYLWAGQPSTRSYVPDKAHSYSSAGTKPHIVRSGRGKYAVSLPGMPKGGSVQIMSFQAGMRCNATSIRTATPQTIGVQCWKISSGKPHDARFTLSYEK